MMISAGVTPEQLRSQGTIANLSWDYYTFAREHEISRCPQTLAYSTRKTTTSLRAMRLSSSQEGLRVD